MTSGLPAQFETDSDLSDQRQAARAKSQKQKSTTPPPPSLAVRLVALAIALTLSGYAGSALKNALSSIQDSKKSLHAQVNASARLAGARTETSIQALQNGLRAGAGLLSRMPNQPLDAAESALKISGAKAVGIFSTEGQSLALTGAVQNRSALEHMARKAGKTAHRGDSLQFQATGGTLYALLSPAFGKEKDAIIIAEMPIDLKALAQRSDLPKGSVLVLVDAQGQILATPRADWIARSVSDALGVDRNTLEALSRQGGIGAGFVDKVGAIDIATSTTLPGNLLLLTASPTPPGLSLQQWSFHLASLAAPLIAALFFGLAIWRQTLGAAANEYLTATSEKRFRTAVEAAKCGIWEWDFSRNQVTLSDVTATIMGFDAAKTVSAEQFLARISLQHRADVDRALKSAASFGAFDVSFQVNRADGTSCWVDARGNAFGDAVDGAYVKLVGVAFDVTQERHIQYLFQQAEGRLRDAIESISGAFVLWDRHEGLVMCNEAYRDLFHLDPKVLRPGRKRDEIEQIALLQIKSFFETHDGRKNIWEVEMANGQWWICAERRTYEGGCVWTATDITAVKQQEVMLRKSEEALQSSITELRQSQDQLRNVNRKFAEATAKAESANKSKSEFLANMSHELRTPLNAINGFSEIMAHEMFGELGDKRYKEYAHDILKSGQHLLALINDILDMSKIEAGKMTLRIENLSIDDVIEDAVRLVRQRASDAGLTLKLDVPEGMPDVEADYRSLKQVILNLLTNAIKFTPRNGLVKVTARMDQAYFTVGVTDTGIGISEDDISRLAKPFEQVESQLAKTKEGTGLGLALSKSLIELHGGELRLSSNLGQGTTVSFTMPVRQPAKPSDRSGGAHALSA